MNQVPLCIRGPPHIIAITPYDITFPHNSQQVLQVQFPFCTTNKVLILEPLDNKNAVGFRVARTLVSVHGREYCLVWNDLDEPITLKYGTPITTVPPILDIIISCSDNESKGDINQQTSIDPDNNKKYIHILNILNKNIKMYNSNNEQQDCRMTNGTYTNTRRHFQANTANRVQSDARHLYGNDARHSHESGARQQYTSRTNEHFNTRRLPEEKVHKTIFHQYEALKLKLENPDLTEDKKQRFNDLIGKFGDVFVLSNMELEGTDILEYDIYVKQDAKPARQKPYNYSEKARTKIDKQVQELLAIKFIRRSTSAWCFNVLLVKKHDKSMTMCIDYRKLNSCIIPEVHPVPTYTIIADLLRYA